jgi:hypothetical protein
MAQTPRIVKPGHCPACRQRFEPHTPVVRTNGGAIVHEEHAWMFVPDAIVFRGRYDQSKP